MRIVRTKKEENNRNIERKEKKHEKEIKTRDERLRRVEADSNVQEKSIADLKKQINKLKNGMNMNIRNETATTNSNKKTVNIRDENEMMKNNIGVMKIEIVEKNRRIAQLETTNTKLYTQNNCLTDLCFRRKPAERDIEKGRSRGE